MLNRLCCVVGLFASSALAQSSGSDAGTVSISGQHHPDAYAVEITFVGQIANDTALALVVEELLGAHGAQSRQRRVSELVESDLLDATSHTESRTIRIWIALRDPAVARLWFAAPTLDRYLWRELALPRGLDAVAREQIAQIVQGSSDALSKGDQGLTRADAQRALQRQRLESLAEDPESTARANQGPTPLVSFRSGQITIRSRRVTLLEGTSSGRFQPTAGAGYGVAYTTRGLGPLHGPLLEIGLGHAKGRHVIGVHLAYEWHLAQSLTRAPAQLELQSQLGWLLFVWQTAVTPWIGFTHGVGFGAEATAVRPNSTVPSTFLATREYTDWAYLIRLRSGLAGTLGHLGWALSACADLSLSETSYGITTSEHGYKSLVELWQIRPGLQLGVFYE